MTLQKIREHKHWTYVGSLYALLGRDEDEADEDGRTQHADGANQRVSPFRPLPAHPGRDGTDHHAQQTRHARNRPEDQTADQRTQHQNNCTVFTTEQTFTKFHLIRKQEMMNVLKWWGRWWILPVMAVAR